MHPPIDVPARPSEFALIDWIRRRVSTTSRVALGIGDDCAILRLSPASELLATTDMLMEGRHFRLEEVGAEAVGYKALAVNLSDIAAMAGLPIAALASVALPRGQAMAVGRGILVGMQPLADRFGVALVGGDTNAWDGPLVVSGQALGGNAGRPRDGDRSARRQPARPPHAPGSARG
jgi:thiamine-monophosphate kinase